MTHGTVSCYQQGCRCPECTKARRDYGRAYRRKQAEARAAADVPEATLEALQEAARAPLPPVYVAGRGMVRPNL